MFKKSAVLLIACVPLLPILTPAVIIANEGSKVQYIQTSEAIKAETAIEIVAEAVETPNKSGIPAILEESIKFEAPVNLPNIAVPTAEAAYEEIVAYTIPGVPDISLPEGVPTIPGIPEITVPGGLPGLPDITVPEGVPTLPGITVPEGVPTLPGITVPEGVPTLPGITVPEGVPTIPDITLPGGPGGLPGGPDDCIPWFGPGDGPNLPTIPGSDYDPNDKFCPPATEPPVTTVPATTVAPTTAPPATTAPATTEAATDAPATTVPATTEAATDAPATTVPATTVAPTTAPPATTAPAASLPQTGAASSTGAVIVSGISSILAGISVSYRRKRRK